jgi:hypothetical protein
MVKHESHSVTVSVNSADAFAESRGELVKSFEQDISEDSSFQMAPQSLDQIKTRAVRRQPVDRDAIGIGLEPFLNPARGGTGRCYTPGEFCDRRTT